MIKMLYHSLILRILVSCLIVVFYTEGTAKPIFAQSFAGADITDDAEAMLSQQLESLDFQGIQDSINKNIPDTGVSFQDLVTQVIKGELNLSPDGLIRSFLSALLGEVRANSGLMRNLLVICVLSAMLKNLSESFKNKAVGELGFYVCYVVLIFVLFTAFNTAAALTQELIAALAQFMQACIPLLISLLIMSGAAGASYVFNPVLTFMVNIVTMFVNGFLAPFVILAAAIEIINYITEKDILTNFSTLLKNVCSWSLKGIGIAFVSILSLQKITAPILNNLVAKSAKAAIGAVPVVGEVLNGAWDLVWVWAQAAKSGVMVALIVVIVVMCMLPVLKLIALIVIFKVTAAIIQPICDERIVKCIDSIGGFSFLLLGCCATVIVMFVLSAVILLSF